MIIHIDWADSSITNENIDYITDALNSVLTAYVEGRHFVVIEPASARMLIDSDKFGSVAEARLRRIRLEYPTRSSVLEKGHAAILQLMPEIEGPLESDGNDKYRIGLRKFVNSKYNDKAILLVEGKEKDIYNLMINEVAKKNALGKLSYDIDIGGGDNTAENLRLRVERGHVVICLADTDKLTPTGKIGTTLKNIHSASKRAEEFVGRICETPGREVENFIPYSIAKRLPISKKTSLFDEGGSVFSKLDVLLAKQGAKIIDDCLWLYYDLKKKITQDRFAKEASDPKSKSWILEKYDVSDIQEIENCDLPVWGEGLIGNLLGRKDLVDEFLIFIRNDEYFKHHFNPWFDGFIFYLLGDQSNRT